ncbi:MAG: FAD binding domain-containing protein [Desulfotomaculaceae bacterium]|nr:FAD binding domain-containing protein [Desulfotomaculaceae bacterium]
MIPFNFEYYKPATAREAVDLFHTLQTRDKNPMYYGGGTEIISFSRLYQLYPKAVIDIKGIPECNVLEFQNDRLVIGAAKTLTQLQESNLFPLLSWCAGRVADHTIRNKITLGGNICSRLPYREAVLALLVADCEVVIQRKGETRTEPLESIFNQSLHLDTGDLLLQVTVNKSHTCLPFFSTKRTANGDVNYPQDRIGYPVLSTAFMKNSGRIHAAFSGLCPFPFRSHELEEVLSDQEMATELKLAKAVSYLPAPILTDIDGTAAYREFVLRNTLARAVEQLEGVNCIC